MSVMDLPTTLSEYIYPGHDRAYTLTETTTNHIHSIQWLAGLTT